MSADSHPLDSDMTGSWNHDISIVSLAPSVTYHAVLFGHKYTLIIHKIYKLALTAVV